MKTKLMYQGLIAVLGLSASSAFAAYCPITQFGEGGYQMHLSWKMMNEENDLTFKSLEKALKTSIKEASGVMVEGTRVKTAQEKINAESISQGIADNQKQQLAIEHAQKVVEKTEKIKENYAPKSVGHKNCKAHEQARKVNLKATDVRAKLPDMMNEITARSGHYANRKEAMASRLTLHDMRYCTKDQATNGLCKQEAPRAGASLVASTLFKPAKQGDDNDIDKNALINNMMGLPDDPIPKSQINTAQGIAIQDRKRQKDALKSIPAYVLKYLQAQSTDVESASNPNHTHNPSDPNHKHGNLSEAEQAKQKNVKETGETEVKEENDTSYQGELRKDVQKHFGDGKEYMERKKYLAGATEKGVMTELVKGNALKLKLLGDMHEKLKLDVALTAAQTIAVMRYVGMDTKIEEARQKLVRQQLNSMASASGVATGTTPATGQSGGQ